jgi:hypothetical protein
VTINLTGPILLGLAVALAVLTYMYIQAFKSWGNFDHRDDFYYDRQFILKVGMIGWNDKTSFKCMDQDSSRLQVKI